jgi:two-component sensor histidine kinase
MRRTSASVGEYAQALDRRIQSMAAAHALLSRNRWEGVDLAELVRSQLAPEATEANALIEGPTITLGVAAAQALAMVLHELATNAAKYGALSSPHGRVEVSWDDPGLAERGGRLALTWKEIGGPAVAEAPECRYGVSTVRDLVPRELGGSVELAFAPAGVCCKVQIPLEAALAARRQVVKPLELQVATGAV